METTTPLTTAVARELRDLGLRWEPRSGDAFRIEGTELEDQLFTVSEMTIEAHHFSTGTVLGFNGTTEWALDEVSLEEALWIPREDQLRSLLGATFVSLTRAEPGFRVSVRDAVSGEAQDYSAETAAHAYALALAALLRQAG